MTKTHRPAPAAPAPDGMRWVPGTVPNANPVRVVTRGTDRKCAARLPDYTFRHNACNAAATAIVDRVFYCTYHLGLRGMWITAGVVLRWRLTPTADRARA